MQRGQLLTQRVAELDDSDAELAAHDGGKCEQAGCETACVCVRATEIEYECGGESGCDRVGRESERVRLSMSG